MNKHEYTWKHGIQFSSGTKLETNRPVPDDAVLIDLHNGHRYRVQAIYPAKATDKEWSFLPDTVLHTFPAGTLADAELNALRDKAGYTPDEFGLPFEAVVF